MIRSIDEVKRLVAAKGWVGAAIPNDPNRNDWDKLRLAVDLSEPELSLFKNDFFGPPGLACSLQVYCHVFNMLFTLFGEKQDQVLFLVAFLEVCSLCFAVAFCQVIIDVLRLVFRLQSINIMLLFTSERLSLSLPGSLAMTRC